MASNESLVLDGLELNDGATFTLEQMEFPPPAKLLEWVRGADSDGSLLARMALHENREITARVRVEQQATMDLALAQLAALNEKLQEAERNPGGITAVWTPADATKSATAYVLSGEVTGLPIVVQGDDAGWFVRAPVITIKLTCKPFLYGVERGDLLDDFSTNTITNYTYGTEGLTTGLSVTGGQLVPAATGLREIYHSVRPFTDTDAWVTLKYTTGASVTNGVWAVTARRLDDSNYLLGYFDASGGLSVYKRDAGTYTALATTSISAPATSTAYWIRFRVEGDVLTVEHWTAAPTDTGSPTATATHTLTGANKTKFGSGVAGRCGLRINTAHTGERYDDFRIAPNKTKSTAPVVLVEIANVSGDVAAEARLVVTDSAGQARRLVRWGLESRYYDPAAPSPVLLDSDTSLVTTGFGGVQASRAGAYDPNASGNNVIRGTLLTAPGAVCGLGDLSHVGTFRVFARVWAAAAVTGTVFVRLAWSEGDGPVRANAYVTPRVVNAFGEVDLGLMTIPPTVLGVQRWTGRIEAYSSVNGETLDVDVVQIVPVMGGYGVARSSIAPVPSLALGWDDFAGITAGTALNGRTAPAGGSWVTSGATTDFTAADAPNPTDETMSRATMSDTGVGRFAVLGGAMTDMDVGVTMARNSVGVGVFQAVVARWVDTSNYLLARVQAGLITGIGNAVRCSVVKVIAGTETLLGSRTVSDTTPEAIAVELIVYGSGQWLTRVYAYGVVVASLTGSDAALATGGTLQSGKPGILDYNPNAEATTRYYDTFFASIPAPESIACWPGQSIEFRSDQTLREDSTGTIWGTPPSYRGARFVVPPAGTHNRRSRIAIMARRNDTTNNADDQITDAITAHVVWTPRYLIAPR